MAKGLGQRGVSQRPQRFPGKGLARGESPGKTQGGSFGGRRLGFRIPSGVPKPKKKGGFPGKGKALSGFFLGLEGPQNQKSHHQPKKRNGFGRGETSGAAEKSTCGRGVSGQGDLKSLQNRPDPYAGPREPGEGGLAKGLGYKI